MKRSHSWISVLTLTLSAVASLNAAPALAAPIVHEATGLSIDIPDSWTVDASNGLVFANSGCGKVSLMLLTATTSDTKRLIAELPTKLASVLNQPAFSDQEPTVTTSHGLQHLQLRGTAIDMGKTVDWSIRLVKANNKHLVLLAHGEIDEHAVLLETIYRTVQNAQPAPSI